MQDYHYKVIHLEIPFNFSYSHNLANRAKTDSIILKLNYKGIISFGECCPRPYVTNESSANFSDKVAKYLPSVLNDFDDSISSLTKSLEHLPDSDTALKCLIESTLIYYLIKKIGKNIFEIFNLEKNYSFTYTAPLTGGSKKAFERMTFLAEKYKMKNVKIKLTNSKEDNISRVLFVKKVFGNDVKIRMDGNEIWNYRKASNEIPYLIDAGVSCFEQIFSKKAVNDYLKTIDRWGDNCEFILDESITTVESANELIETKHAHGACIKISKNGGFLQSIEIAKRLKENNLSVRLGCHVGETSYLSLLGLVFSMVTNPSELEGALSSVLLEYDPFTPKVLFQTGGLLNVNQEFKNKYGKEINFKIKS
jgi:muconate cycloisomerase